MTRALRLAELNVGRLIAPTDDPREGRLGSLRMRRVLLSMLPLLAACVSDPGDRNGPPIASRSYVIDGETHTATFYRHAYFYGQERDSDGKIVLYDGVPFENLVTMDGDGEPKIVVSRRPAAPMSVSEEEIAFRVARMLCADLALEASEMPTDIPEQEKEVAGRPSAVWEMGSWGVFNLCH